MHYWQPVKHCSGANYNGKDGGPDGFLEEFRDPPVALLVERADRDSPGSNWPTLTRDNTLGPTWPPQQQIYSQTDSLVAARLIFNNTKVGFHSNRPVSGEGV